MRTGLRAVRQTAGDDDDSIGPEWVSLVLNNEGQFSLDDVSHLFLIVPVVREATSRLEGVPRHRDAHSVGNEPAKAIVDTFPRLLIEAEGSNAHARVPS